MSLHEEVLRAIQQEIEAAGAAVVLSPSTLAIGAQRRLCALAIEPRIAYTSLEHLKQIARRELRGRFDADGEANEAHQGDMFSEHLQDRYPIQHAAESEPQYKLRALLTDDEIDFNIAQLRRSATARQRHADALQAWRDSRGERRAAA